MEANGPYVSTGSREFRLMSYVQCLVGTQSWCTHPYCVRNTPKEVNMDNEHLLDTFYFVNPVLGYMSYSPEGYGMAIDKTGVVTMTIKTEKVDVDVEVPWSNIAFYVECQDWK